MRNKAAKIGIITAKQKREGAMSVMYHSMLYYYLAFAAIVVIASAVASIALIRRQQHHEEDHHGMSKATARHYFLLNPALIAYVLFPVAVAFGAWLLYKY